jgi:hypothetical protein
MLDGNYIDFINNNPKAFSRKNTKSNLGSIVMIPDGNRPISAFENSKNDINFEQLSNKIKIMKKPLKKMLNPNKSLNVTNEKLKNLLEEPNTAEIINIAKLGT